MSSEPPKTEETRTAEDEQGGDNVDFDDLLFDLNSEQLMKLPYFTIIKKE